MDKESMNLLSGRNTIGDEWEELLDRLEVLDPINEFEETFLADMIDRLNRYKGATFVSHAQKDVIINMENRE